ncbi:MAG: ORF6N domain-containing protein [Candidatus Woesearchaeota archaeon]
MNEIELTIKNKIYNLRGKQVMLDKDLAKLYNISTKRLKEQVKRNIERFPEDFMFELNKNEVELMGSQFATPSKQEFGGYLPFVFTEQGVAMLSSVLRSEIAIKINIQIMRAFVQMRKFLQSNADFLSKLSNLETKQIEYQIKTDEKFEQVFNLIQEKDIKPEKGIFFNGQIFEAYFFINKLIKSAKKEMILIDNYIDESILTLFSKTKLKTTIYTKEITKQLKLDLEKYNQQYNNIQINEFKDSHDRFLIIDNEVYHIGASLKDLGKKWFAFSKLNINSLKIIDKLKK